MNPRLVRGLDYYNNTVFEWVTDALGAQGTVCAGGRYDGLVAQLGGRPTPGVGFAMGMERLVLMLQESGSAPPARSPDIFAVTMGDAAQRAAAGALEALREALPGRIILAQLGGGSFRSQMKKADRSGAAIALLWGEDEVAAGEVTVKDLRGDTPQQRVAAADLPQQVERLLAQTG